MTPETKDKLKRLAAFVVTGVVIALNNKLGLNMDGASIAALTAVTIAFISQSAWKETAIAKAEAAGTAAEGKVEGMQEALAMMGKKGPNP